MMGSIILGTDALTGSLVFVIYDRYDNPVVFGVVVEEVMSGFVLDERARVSDAVVQQALALASSGNQ